MTDLDPDDPPWLKLSTQADLERLGAAIAQRLTLGDAICLSGPLGAGKSTLARGLIRALAGAEEAAPSPTFTLVQTYETPRLQLAHLDLYRLHDAEEALELGLDEALDQGAAVIEWPERLGDHRPAKRLDVELRFPANGATDGRDVRLAGCESWVEWAKAFGRGDL